MNPKLVMLVHVNVMGIAMIMKELTVMKSAKHAFEKYGSWQVHANA